MAQGWCFCPQPLTAYAAAWQQHWQQTVHSVSNAPAHAGVFWRRGCSGCIVPLAGAYMQCALASACGGLGLGLLHGPMSARLCMFVCLRTCLHGLERSGMCSAGACLFWVCQCGDHVHVSSISAALILLQRGGGSSMPALFGVCILQCKVGFVMICSCYPGQQEPHAA